MKVTGPSAKRWGPVERLVSEVIGPLPKIAPKKHVSAAGGDSGILAFCQLIGPGKSYPQSKKLFLEQP